MNSLIFHIYYWNWLWTAMPTILASFLLVSCSFNFELTSQRTALENQIMGSYEELESDVVLSSSVRGVDKNGKTKKIPISDLKAEAILARQNQEFNLDDLMELKDNQIIGEGSDGLVTILPESVGEVKTAPNAKINLAKQICAEENSSRAIIWRRIIDTNVSLSQGDLAEIRYTFARLQRDTAKKGQWTQAENGSWLQKN